MLFAGVTVGTGDVGIGVGDGISVVVPDPLIWRLIPVTPCMPLPIPAPFPTSTSGAAASVAGIAIPFFVLAIRYAPLPGHQFAVKGKGCAIPAGHDDRITGSSKGIVERS